MNEKAAHWVERVIPLAATRQFVLTVPWPRRFLGRLSWGWVHLPVALAAMVGARAFFQFGLARYSSSGA